MDEIFYIYLVTSDHRFFELYFEDRTDAEDWVKRNSTTASGLKIYSIPVIKHKV